MVKTWMADELFPGLPMYYNDLEKRLNAKFHYELPIYRPFVSVEEQNDWLGNSSKPHYQTYISEVKTSTFLQYNISNPYGGIMLSKTGYLDLPVFLDTVKEYLENKGLYRQEMFDSNHMKIENTNISYKDISAEKVIFCEGTQATNNIFFETLKFRPVKGEVIDVELDFPSNLIVNRGVFMIPRSGYVRVGATYDNHNLDLKVTKNGINTLKEKLGKIYQGEYRIIRSWAGIRPATFDRRPYIGFHSEKNNVGIFNGFGTKGVSLVPYFAKLLVENMLSGKELISEVRIDR